MSLPGVRQLLRLTEVDSTQTLARSMAEQGAPEWTLVWADQQTAGRGRLSRKWDSPPGGLYASLILRPSFPPKRLAELSLLTARAAAEALSALTGIETAVKAPNDVLAVKAGKAKKICGILAEASGGSGKLEWLVIGVGVNVNNAPRGRKSASSLRALTGRAWDIEAALRLFLARFQEAYSRFELGTMAA